MASACASALIGLSALNALAQNCNPGIGGNLGLSGPYPVPNDVYVHVGQPLTITSVNVQNSGTCTLTNLRCWIVYPDNTFQMFVDMGTTQFAPGGNFTCSGAGSGNCLPFTTTYVVKQTDINNTLSFTTNWPPGQNTMLVSGSFGIDNVQVMFAEAAGAIRQGGGVARQSPGAGLIVLAPCVNVTKSCPTCTPYGQPIAFSGTVSNCTVNNHADPADSRLLNVNVNDNHPGAIITFSTTTRLGNPFPANGGGTLLVNDSVNYTGSYMPPNTGGSSLCGPFDDTVTVIAADRTGFTVTNTASARCHVQTRPAITLTKDCQPRIITIGSGPQTYRETFVVCNTGDVPLTGVVINDSKVGPIAIGNLAPGQCVTNIQGPFTVTAADCPSVTDRATATGNNICPADAMCPAPQTVTSAEQTCTVRVDCPSIRVWKQVVCYTNGICEPFSANLDTQKTATGVRIDPPNAANCPAFCYRITVRNTGNVPLNLTVSDNSTPDPDLNLSGCGFPAVLAPGATAQCVVSPVTHCANTLNVVTVNGVTDQGATVSAMDTNNVTVIPLGIACELQVSTNGGVNFFPPGADCPMVKIGSNYIVRVKVTNTGQYPLQNVYVTNLLGLASCLPAPLNIGTLAVGEMKTQDCNFTCTQPGRNDYRVAVSGQASQSPNHVCDFNVQGRRIEAQSECNASVCCFGVPGIEVRKQVVCFTNGVCEPFSPNLNTQKTATGVRIDPPNAANCPAFCYRITVRNTGDLTLTLTVTDNSVPDPDLNLSGCGFPPTLAPGATAQCVVSPVTHCQNTVNIVTANGVTDSGMSVSATDTNTVTVIPLGIACELLVSTNGGANFFNPGATCPQVMIGSNYIVRVKVTNTGLYPLQKVTITGVAGMASCLPVPLNIGNLAVNEMRTQDCVFTCTQPGRNDYRVAVSGEAAQSPDHVCDFNVQGQRIVARSECSASVCCLAPPRICVEKLVTCKDPGVDCQNASGYAKLAQGVRGDPDPTCTQANSGCPAFCYKVTVSNCGLADLRDVTLRDDNGTPGTLGDDIATPIGNLAAGQSRTVYYSSAHCADSHNIVVAEGQSVFDSTAQGHVTASDFADVRVHPIMIMCRITLDAGILDMDGKTVDDTDPNVTCRNGGVIGDAPEDNAALLPVGFSGPVCFNLYLTNPKNIDLDVTITLPPAAQAIPALVACIGQGPVIVPANSTRIISCSLDFDQCPETFDGDVKVKGTARATGDIRCIANACGHAATTAESSCAFNIRCAAPPSCRTTGGGNLLPGFVDQSCIPVVTQIFPSTGVDHISHGGQLGAPFSQMDCGAILGNPCIRGEWEHQRHYQGNGNPRDVIDMNFHSANPKGAFDSLSCACLGCCDPLTGAFIPPTVGPLIHKFQICNPDDHKMCGPQPRPAPANALIFSGIGRLTPTDDITGPRANRSEWVIFRVYIEDRSEPGNGHANASFPTEPADIYCFQAWKTGIKTSRKPDFTTISTAFRMALGQANCDFLHALETGVLPIGSLPSPTVNGLTADIQDCGPLYNGNRQIHPSTGATCNQ